MKQQTNKEQYLIVNTTVKIIHKYSKLLKKVCSNLFDSQITNKQTNEQKQQIALISQSDRGKANKLVWYACVVFPAQGQLWRINR